MSLNYIALLFLAISIRNVLTKQDSVLEQLYNSVNTLIKNVENLKEENRILKQRTDNYEQMYHKLESQMDILESAVEKDRSIYKKQSDNFIRDTNMIKKSVAQLKANLVQTPIAFSVALTSDVQLGDREIIQFDHVTSNYGNGYDPRTGQFTAQVSGLYMFSASLMGPPHHECHVQVVKNGVELARVSADAQDWEYGSNTVFTTLAVGDVVSVIHYPGQPVETAHGQLYTAFSGALITNTTLQL